MELCSIKFAFAGADVGVGDTDKVVEVVHGQFAVVEYIFVLFPA